MHFLKSLFRNRKAERDHIYRYVQIEYRPSERDDAYTRMIKMAGL